MISLEEIGCYKRPEIVSDSPNLVRAVNELNKIAGAEIVYEFGDDTETVSYTHLHIAPVVPPWKTRPTLLGPTRQG